MNHIRRLEDNLEYHFSEVLEYPLVRPYWVYISLSHKCTYNCKMCGVVKILRGHELPKATVKKALDEISRWKGEHVVMFTGGETFLRKDIFELISYAVKKGIKAEAVSNGSLISEAMAEKIIKSGLHNIAISLDGATEKTHEFIREKGSFAKALNALSSLVAAKKKHGSGPQISAWTTIMKENLNELYDIIPLVKELGVECLVYHPVIVAQDDMQNTSASAPFWIKAEELETLKKQIDRIVEYKFNSGLVAFLHDPYLWIKYFQASLTKDDWKCNPFVFLNIGPDADVRSCGSAFGNINSNGLEEVLLSEDALQARKAMKACQKPCLQTCWAHPESDSLTAITADFISGIRNEKEKKKLLKEALNLLGSFEERLRKEAQCLS